MIRRFGAGAESLGPAMIAAALAATAVNALCIRLLARDRRADVNLRAAWTFSVNDFLSNLGIVVAGALVCLLGRNWPDLVVGLAIAAVAVYGGIEILRDAARSRRGDDASDPARPPCEVAPASGRFAGGRVERVSSSVRPPADERDGRGDCASPAASAGELQCSGRFWRGH